MRRMWVAVGLGLLGILAGAPRVVARDYSPDWKFSAVLHPEARYTQTAQPDFDFRRIRLAATGPFSQNLRAKVQVDVTKPRMKLKDLYLDWTAFDGPVRVTLRGGQFQPAWAKEGQTFANTVEYAYVTAASRTWDRNTGGQITFGFLDGYEASLAITNGLESLNDNNKRLDYVVSFAAQQPHYRAHGWFTQGCDGAPGSECRTWMWGAEFTDIHAGRFLGNVAYISGENDGAEFNGGFFEVGYTLNEKSALWGKFDWADLDRHQPDFARQRATVSYHWRANKNFALKSDMMYTAHDGEWQQAFQGEIRF